MTLARLRPLVASIAALATVSPAGPARADEAAWQRDRAIDCAALAYIATALYPPESAEGQLFTDRSTFFTSLMGAHLQAARPDVAVTNGDLADAKSARIDLLIDLSRTDPDEVVAVNRLCWEWSKGFGLRMSSDPGLDPLIPLETVRIPLDIANVAAADTILEESLAAFDGFGVTPAIHNEALARVPLD
jgi:hypothetical protein